jgi:Tn3 transposase DDE domain
LRKIELPLSHHLDQITEAQLVAQVMHAALNQLRAEGYLVLANDVARLSPLSFKRINTLGRYAFNLSDTASRGELRPPRRKG